MSVHFDYYKVFYYVAKYQNFTKAAHVLLSSQPSVTRCIQNLENELGCRLFIRSKRGVTLTSEGELLYHRVGPAYESILKAEEELNNTVSLHGGSIHIGATETALRCFLLEKLSFFHSQHPDVRVRITTYTTAQAVSDLWEGKIDVAIVVAPISVEPPLKATSVRLVHDCLIAGTQFSNLRGRKISLKETVKYPIVCLASSTLAYHFFENFYASHGLALKPDIELTTADLILPMVEHNLGLGLLPRELAEDSIKNGKVYEIDLEEKLPPRSICVVKDPHRPLNAAARHFLKLLQEDSHS